MSDANFAIHSYDLTPNWWLSQRDNAPPGAGTWSKPTAVMNVDPSIGPLANCTAGPENATDPYGMVGGGAGISCYYAGNNGTNPPVPISTLMLPASNFQMVDFWNMASGAWTYSGSRWLLLIDSVNRNLPMLKGTVAAGDVVTWAEQDNAHAPNGLTFLGQSTGVAIRHKANLVDVIYQVAPFGTTNLVIQTFDFKTGTWSAPFAALALADQIGFNSNESLYRYANGDIGIVYHDVTDGKAYYQLWSAGAWGARILIGPATRVDQLIPDPSGALLHVFVDISGADFQPVYYRVTHAGAVTGPIFTFPLYFSSDGVGHGAINNSKIFLPYDTKDIPAAQQHNRIFVAALGGNTFFPEDLPKPAAAAGSSVTCAFALPGAGPPVAWLPQVTKPFR